MKKHISEEYQNPVRAVRGFVLHGGKGTGDDDEHPAHTVSVDGFYMATHEVTQEEYERVTGENPSRFARGGSYPVENVSWYDALRYCNLRSKQEGLEPCYYVLDDSLPQGIEYFDSWQDFFPDQSGEYPEIHCDWSANGYRLPTEAEWEYASRGGNESHEARGGRFFVSKFGQKNRAMS